MEKYRQSLSGISEILGAAACAFGADLRVTQSDGTNRMLVKVAKGHGSADFEIRLTPLTFLDKAGNVLNMIGNTIKNASPLDGGLPLTVDRLTVAYVHNADAVFCKSFPLDIHWAGHEPHVDIVTPARATLWMIKQVDSAPRATRA
jgi:hypothetical protein